MPPTREERDRARARLAGGTPAIQGAAGSAAAGIAAALAYVLDVNAQVLALNARLEALLAEQGIVAEKKERRRRRRKPVRVYQGMPPWALG
jgi:hypothetical protein